MISFTARIKRIATRPLTALTAMTATFEVIAAGLDAKLDS